MRKKSLALVFIGIGFTTCLAIGNVGSFGMVRTADVDARRRVSPVDLFAHPVTSLGENTQARYSPSGEMLLYISKNRAAHPQPQVYSLKLSDRSERRLTFHDGDDQSPAWKDDEHFLFSSTTDSRKQMEQIVLILVRQYLTHPGDKPTEAPPIGSEIYEQSLDGREIARLTDAPGINTDPDFNPRDHRIFMTSIRTGTSGVFELDSKYKPQAVVPNTAGDREPVLSPNGDNLAWIHSTNDGYSHLTWTSFKNKKNQIQLAGNEIDRDPKWGPSGEALIFSSNRGGRTFNLYLADRATGCLRQLTHSDRDLFYPEISPDSRTVLFTASRSSSEASQIFQIELQPDVTCTPAVVVNSMEPVAPSSSPTQSPTATPSK